MNLKPVNQSIYKQQLALLIFVIIPATKFILLPSLLSFTAGRDSTLLTVIMSVLDFFILFLIIKAIKIAPDANFSEILNSTFGKILTKLILVLYAFYFVFRTYPVIFENHDLLLGTLYRTIPFFDTFLPFLIVIVYIASKGPRVLGRNANYYFLFSAFSLFLIVILSIGYADFSNLLPILYDGISPVIEGIRMNIFWFGDFTFIIMMMGKIYQAKGSFKAVYISAIITLFSVVFFISLYTAVFGTNAHILNYSLTQLSKFQSYASNNGKYDWVAVFIVILSSILNASVMIFCSSECIKQAFNLKNKSLISIGCSALIVLMMLYSNENFSKIYIIFSEGFLIFFIFMQYLLPAVLPLLALRYNKSKKNRSVQ